MWYMILLIVGLIIVGLIVKIIDIRKRVEEYNFSTDYYNKLVKLFNNILSKRDFSNNDYAWLMSNSDKMQYILGGAGIISYKEYNMLYNNVPILINVMNEIASLANDSCIIDNDIKMLQWCENAFLRKIGILDEYTKNEPKKLLNPFYNLANGIRWILGIPVNILYSIGLISYNGKNKIEQNILFRLLGSILSLLTILSTIMTIIIGWDEFIEIIKQFL